MVLHDLRSLLTSSIRQITNPKIFIACMTWAVICPNEHYVYPFRPVLVTKNLCRVTLVEVSVSFLVHF